MSLIEPAERIVKLPDLKFWTDERFEQAKAMWADGKSASEIAKSIGATRNAVIGKLHRHGFFRIGKRVLGTRADVNRHRTSRIVGKLKLVRFAGARIIEASNGERTELTETAPQSQNVVSLFELNDEHCRWPCWTEKPPHLFCGAPRIKGSSYCGHHHWIARRGSEQ